MKLKWSVVLKCVIRITYFEETLLTTRYSGQIRWFEFSRNFWPNYVIQWTTHFCLLSDYHHLHSSTSFPLFHTIAKTICIITCQSNLHLFPTQMPENYNFPWRGTRAIFMDNWHSNLWKALWISALIKSPISRMNARQVLWPPSQSTSMRNFWPTFWFLLTGFSQAFVLSINTMPPKPNYAILIPTPLTFPCIKCNP